MARLSIKKDKFYIDDKLTYSEYMPHSGRYLGMLFNQRLIQGVFDDPGHYDKYVRQGLPEFSPETNTDNLIKALPNWYSCGLRAITVGFQGGWPHSVVPADQINNNPFGADGKELDTKYADRMDRIIKAADKIGMIVIVNFLYWAQSR